MIIVTFILYARLVQEATIKHIIHLKSKQKISAEYKNYSLFFSADYWAKKLTSQRVDLSNSQTYYTIRGIKPSYNKVIELSCIIWVK